MQYEQDTEAEGAGDSSVLQAMRENPDLVKIIDALLISQPSIGRNMARRHLAHHYVQHKDAPNRISWSKNGNKREAILVWFLSSTLAYLVFSV